MQFTNSVVCDTRKDSLYKQIKPLLVGEHAFPFTGLLCKSTHVTNGGSGGIMSTARVELPFPCYSHAKSREEISRGGGEIDLTVQITNSVVCDTSKGSLYKQIKLSLVSENAFPLTVFVFLSAYVTNHAM